MPQTRSCILRTGYFSKSFWAGMLELSAFLNFLVAVKNCFNFVIEGDFTFISSCISKTLKSPASLTSRLIYFSWPFVFARTFVNLLLICCANAAWKGKKRIGKHWKDLKEKSVFKFIMIWTIQCLNLLIYYHIPITLSVIKN